MTTPGTPQWMRETADRLLKEAAFPHSLEKHAEGLIRAANRIERLQGELSKAKTGVDQTQTPLVHIRSETTHMFPEPDMRISIHLPENSALHERLLEWIMESGDCLDPCILTVEGDLKTKDGENTERLTLVNIEDMDRRFKQVRIQAQTGAVLDLTRARALAIGPDKWGEERLSLAGKVQE